MSITYHVSTRLDAELNIENISKIIDRCSQLGMIFFEKTCVDKGTVSSKEAITKMYQGDDLGDRFLDVGYQDTYIGICFFEEGELVVMFSWLSTNWSKTFENDEEDIDIARYVEVMLDIVGDFKILEMEVKKD